MHLLGDGKAALEKLVERDAQRACAVGGAHGVFHLAQNLRFAQHHAVQPAGYAKGVARGLSKLQIAAISVKRR